MRSNYNGAMIPKLLAVNLLRGDFVIGIVIVIVIVIAVVPLHFCRL